MIKEGETKDEFTKRKRDERKKTLHEGKFTREFIEKTRNIAHKFTYTQEISVILIAAPYNFNICHFL